MSYSKGVSWIADCRIPFVDEGEIWTAKRSETNNPFHLTINKDGVDYGNQQGRFTPNLLVCDDMLNDGSVSKSSDNVWIGGKEKNWKGHSNKRIHAYSDKGSNSRYYDLDLWFNKMVDEL